MAKIPLGEFGQLVAQAQRTPTASAAQLDGGRSEAAQRLAGTAMGIAGQRLEDLAQQDRQAQKQAELEVRRAADQHDRLTSSEALARLRNDADTLAAEIAQDVALGKIPPADTGREFDQRSEKMLRDRLGTMRPDLAEQVRVGTIEDMGRARLKTLGASAAQTRSLAKGALMGLGEELQRAALADRPRAVALYQASLLTSGPEAGMQPDDIQRELANFKEKTARAHADALINGARDDMASLDAVQRRLTGPEFADLAPEQRGPLEARVLQRKQFLDNQRTQQVIRQQAQAERRERGAERAIGELEKMVDSGQMPDTQTMKVLADRVSGTSYAPTLRSLVSQAGDRAGFAQLSPDQQRAKIMELRTRASTQGTNPDLQARIARYEQIQNTTQAALKEDALTHGARAGLVTLQPLDLRSLNTLGEQLAVRSQAAETVAVRVKRDVSVFTRPEAEQVGDMLGMLAAREREKAVTQLARSMTPGQGQALAKQIEARDPSLGLALFQAATNPSGAALPLILRGQDALKAGRIKDDEQAKRDAQTIAKQMEAINWGTPTARDYAAKTAEAILAGMRDRGGANVREAVRLATGGVGEWGDSRVPLPPGMEPRQFERRLEALATDPAQLATAMGTQQVTVGGKTLSVAEFSRQFNRVKLISAGPGRYALDAGGEVVLGANGRPARIDLRK